ncbi:Cytosol non-specific dipeptidase [Anaerohalosphaera lusitana]|uniref:Cytosol non-specific dipeptidase n=1 Tax=Anaerohalosphaera lusitana TaxID=1936003 RepID=A0A1U9NKH7_9BACT|nr:aminoacyl-histidine dipeptidase [Anaerohalosphaera lusitana]AQT68307.1 Cytosol non-specific dipeptidase [Anaerohalosphaera lusitana]
MKLSDAKAQNVWDIFRRISQIPRPSKHEEQICQWLKDFANKHRFKWQSDHVNNIVIHVPATPGMENSLPVTLQGHVDMVCEKTPDSTHDFSKDPITIIEKDGWATADKTTLGADNGIGVAISLALATDDTVKHPPLELLFTVDEETGLTGAAELQANFIKGRKLINIDTEDEGVFTIGCAGGIQTEIALPVNFVSADPKAVQMTIEIDGLAGGHSGVNIHEQRANAIKLLGRVLSSINDELNINICHLQGGSAHNAIPRNASAMIAFAEDQKYALDKKINDLQTSLANELGPRDSKLKILVHDPSTPSEKTLDTDSTKSTIDLIIALPDGVDRYSFDVEGLVETSNNIATLSTDIEDGMINIMSSQRSCIDSALSRITGRIEATAKLAGANPVTNGKYPGWEPNPDSDLLNISREVYKKVRGKETKIEAIHAGLECGLLGEKFEGMDMISIGATIENPHSPQERVNIESVDHLWNFLKALLPELN